MKACIAETENYRCGSSRQYSIVETKIEIEGKTITTYGIRASLTDSVGQKVSVSIVNDISSEKEKVEKLLDMLIRNEVSPANLYEIVEDFLD